MHRHEILAVALYAAVLVALLLAVLVLVEGSLVRVANIIKDNLAVIALSSLLIAGEEALKSTRFVVLSRASGKRLTIRSALEIHFSSLAIGALTPAFSGSVPTATAMIGDRLEIDVGEALSLALGVSFFDSAIPALAVVAISWMHLPESALALLISVAVLLAWAVAFNKRALGAMTSLLRFLARGGLVKAVEEEANRFREAFLKLTYNRRALAAVALISVASYIVESISVLILVPGRSIGLLRAFEALMLSYVGGNLPTPGGEGGVEYGLSILVPRATVVMWRGGPILGSPGPPGALYNRFPRHTRVRPFFF